MYVCMYVMAVCDGQDLGLVRGTWSLISERVGSILLRLEEAALTSYQIKVDHGHKVVRALFNKMA